MQQNIVFIQAESLDGRALGCMGESGAHTPNLDQLAEEGALFERAYCNSPQCCPSRSSMWAGRYVWQVGAWNNYRGLPDSERTFVDDLVAAGYQEAIVGRTDHRSGSHSVPARMSAWVRSAPDALFCNAGPKHSVNERGREQRPPDWRHLETAKQWLTDERSAGQPFFLHLGLVNTHPGAGYNASRYWLDKIDADRVTMPPDTAETHPVMLRMQVTKGCNKTFSDEFVRTCRRHYLAMIAEVDAIVGELMETLKALGLYDSTTIIFTADHGDMRFEHGQYLKNAQYEGSARVPLIMAGPTTQAGRRVPQPVSLIDLYPTLMDLADTEGRVDLEGHSLAPLAAGEASTHPGIVLSEYHSNFQQTGSFMLRMDEWKYMVHVGYEPQLFNLERDPAEAQDLAAAEPALVREFDTRLCQMVDYEAVDAAAKAMDAAELASWALQYEEDDYLEAMGALANCWDEGVAARFAAWFEETRTVLRRLPKTPLKATG